MATRLQPHPAWVRLRKCVLSLFLLRIAPPRIVPWAHSQGFTGATQADALLEESFHSLRDTIPGGGATSSTAPGPGANHLRVFKLALQVPESTVTINHFTQIVVHSLRALIAREAISPGQSWLTCAFKRRLRSLGWASSQNGC